jgi:hypothetical protein
MNDRQDQPGEACVYGSSTPQPKREIEWRALAYGYFVGLLLVIIQNAIWGVFWRDFWDALANNVGFSVGIQRYDAFMTSYGFLLSKGMSLMTSLGIGVAVGFIASFHARYHPYRTAFIARILLLLSGYFFTWLQTRFFAGWFISLKWPMLLSWVVGLLGAAYGAYLAESFKRNRGVRIN